MTPVKTTTRKGAKASRRTAKKVTLDDVWVTIEEIGQAHKETEAGLKELQAAHKETEVGLKELQAAHKETEVGLKELQAAHKETEAVQKETQRIVGDLGNSLKETQRIVGDLGNTLKETQRIVGDLGNKFGDEAEHTLVPGLLEKFKQLDFNFGVLNPNRKVKDKEHDIHIEVDAFLENGTQTMAVEVKAKLQMADVDIHIKRMEKLRRYADLHGDRRALFGAMAATVVSNRERDYALEKGLYVIEPSGEDVKITKPDTEWRL